MVCREGHLSSGLVYLCVLNYDETTTTGYNSGS